MSLFTWNLLLALLWALITADFTLYNLFIGALLGFVVLFIAKPLFGKGKYFTRLPLAVAFALYFIKELVVSSLRVAFEVITPGYGMRPGVIAVPLSAKTDAEITILANLITLTPGTLSLDVSSDKKVLYIHAMYVMPDAEAVRREIKEGLERRILEVLR
ncbi:MAG: Na+/H+ antiporter subunit E [Deinococcota bacterium]|jgi:multicomponent Na+:H+ antiporter subunit E|nr:Na+/H+ antiporter subunit E [Deinococcota bacterium]